MAEKKEMQKKTLIKFRRQQKVRRMEPLVFHDKIRTIELVIKLRSNMQPKLHSSHP